MFNTEQQQYLVEFFTNKADTFRENAKEDAELADMYLGDAEQCEQTAKQITADVAVVCNLFKQFDIEEDLLCEIAELDERNDIVDMLVA